MENQLKTRPWKKILSVALSIIIAFGTFVTLTFGNSKFQEWLGIYSMLSAYAAEHVETNGAVALDKETMLADDHAINLENRDGSNTLYLFSEAITYTDEDGDLKAKDISVEKSNKDLKAKGYDYTNGSNDYRINFSKDYKTGVEVVYKDASFSIMPETKSNVIGEESVATSLNENFEVFQYENIYGNGTNLRFYPQLNGVKDEIILNDKIANNTFSFKLKTSNCSAALNEDGTISILDKNSKDVQSFAAPFAYDSKYIEGDKNEHYIDCSYSLLEIEKNEYLITVNVDKNWLNSKNTVYPVTIDPTTSNLSNSIDAGVYSGNASANYGSEVTACFGKSSDYGYGRVYSKFTMPSDIYKGATINSAYQWERETTGRTTSTKVKAYLVKSNWSETAINWNTKPAYNADVHSNERTISSNSSDTSSPYWYKFDIKTLVKKWADGTSNYGMVFVSNEETEKNNNWRAFAARNYTTSSYRPYTVINYTNETNKPVPTITKDPAGWTNQDVIFTVEATDSDSGLAASPYSFSNSSSTYNWGTTKVKKYTKNQTVYFAFKDKAGNIQKNSRGTYIDRLKPSAPSTSSVSSNWTKNNITVTASSTDASADDNNGKSGVKYYSISTEENKYSWKLASAIEGSYDFSISANGTYYIYSKDQAGNISNKKQITISTIDKIAPEIIDINEEIGDDDKLVVTVLANDPQSGLANEAYSFDGGEHWQSSNVAEVERNYHVMVRDNVGNIADAKSAVEPPLVYEENDLIHLVSRSNKNTTVKYKIDDGEYVNYTGPFSIPTNRNVVVTAIDTAFPTRNTTQTFNHTIGYYEESSTDFTVSRNDVSFDFSRYYTSNTGEWFYSIDSKVEAVDSDYLYLVQMPDNSVLGFEKDTENVFKNENTDYTLSVNNEFVIDTGSIKYGYDSNGKLEYIEDEKGNRISIQRQNNKILISYNDGTNNYVYEVNISNNRITSVETPMGEVLKYHYNLNGKLTKVYYDKDDMNIKKENDYIISEYSYDSSGKITQNLDLSIEYYNSGNNQNKVKQETLANGQYSKYDYDGNTVSTTSSYTVDSNDNVIEKTTSVTYNNSLNIAQEVDEEGKVTEYTYDDNQRLVKATTIENDDETILTSYKYVDDNLVESFENDATTHYTYYDDGKVKSSITDDEKTEYTYSGDNISSIKTYTRETEASNEEVSETTDDVDESDDYDDSDDYSDEEDEDDFDDVEFAEDEEVSYKLYSNAEYTYSSNGDLSSVITTTYDEDCTTVETETYNNNTTITVTEETAVSNGVTTVSTTTQTDEYNTLGQLISSSSIQTIDNNPQESLSSTTYSYDALGRSTVTNDLCNNTQSYNFYDCLGNVILTKDVYSDKTEYSRSVYDEYGRLVQSVSNDYYSINNDGLSLDGNNHIDSSSEDSYNGDDGTVYSYNESTFNLDTEKNDVGVLTSYSYNIIGAKVTESFNDYVFYYDDNENTKRITVSGQTYADYEYNDNNNPTSVSFGNGQSIRYVYDENNNLKYQYHNSDNDPYIVYNYNETRPTDDELEVALANEEVSEDAEVAIETNDEFVLTSKVNYDTNQRIEYNDNIVSVYDATSNQFIYSYNMLEEDNSTHQFATGSYSYSKDTDDENTNIFELNNAGSLDSFVLTETEEDEDTSTSQSSLSVGDNSVITKNYTYDNSGNITNESIALNGTTLSYSYTYNNDNNITSFIRNNTLNTDESGSYYHYDNITKALVRADYNHNSSGETNTFEYDDRGNIIANNYFSYTAPDVEVNPAQKHRDSLTFEYDSSDCIWSDELRYLRQDGDITTQFLYDKNGNPVSLDELNLRWTSGRMLAAIYYTDEDTNQDIDILSYTYDENGIRTSKTYEGVTTYYTTDNGIITSQYELDENGNVTNQLIFIYDSDESLVGFTYDNNTYFYITNHLGDVMGIADSNGNLLVEYDYDAWGNCTNSVSYDSSDIAEINPMRYRSYYYDSDLGMYYLQSRYYLSGYSRFLNADLPEYAIQQKEDYYGTNLFAYCCNEPVNNSDPSGYFKKDYHKSRSYSVCIDLIKSNLKFKHKNYAKDSNLRKLANKIAQGSYDVDIKYNSTQNMLNRYCQSFHFNVNSYKPNTEDTRISRYKDFLKKAKASLNSAEKIYKKDKNKCFEYICKAFYYFGMSLHPRQDMISHSGKGGNLYVLSDAFDKDGYQIPLYYYHLPGYDNPDWEYLSSGETKAKKFTEVTKNLTKSFLKEVNKRGF